MNHELEAILTAYEAVLTCSGDDLSRLQSLYDSRVEDVLARHPKLDRARLEAAIKKAYSAWEKANKKYPTLPPKA